MQSRAIGESPISIITNYHLIIPSKSKLMISFLEMLLFDGLSPSRDVLNLNIKCKLRKIISISIIKHSIPNLSKNALDKSNSWKGEWFSWLREASGFRFCQALWFLTTLQEMFLWNSQEFLNPKRIIFRGIGEYQGFMRKRFLNSYRWEDQKWYYANKN